VSSGRWRWWRCLQFVCKTDRTRVEIGKRLGKTHEQRGSRGGAQVDGNLPLAGEGLLDDLEFSGDVLSSAMRRRGTVEGWEEERKQMRASVASRGLPSIYKQKAWARSRWTSSETIRRRGRFLRDGVVH
jgi:hypothetical protein